MNVLVLNAGSSSLKFQLLECTVGGSVAERRLARGAIERVGGESALTLVSADGTSVSEPVGARDHAEALDRVLSRLGMGDAGSGGSPVSPPAAVGHRVVHGGERFSRSVVIDDEVLLSIEAACDLAPLHNPHNLAAIRAARARLGSAVPQVAVFDTAFHHTLPEHAYLYALPYSMYERHRVRRYGFHGTSHRYVVERHGALAGDGGAGGRLISLHLGNGCSACAVMNGASVDVSMGFTPLEGLVMGTRCGDLDPALHDYIGRKEGLSLPQVLDMLNRESGLLGVSGQSNDVRELLRAADRGERRASLALQLFAYRVRKYIGAYAAALGGVDAVVFTGGIGENAPAVRRMICEGLEWLGLELDSSANDATVGGREGVISPPSCRLPAWVIPTDEEILIARDTAHLVRARPD